jgi:D-amino-acid dehydrogenase
MSERRPDVIVVGGGIVGASAAAFLADGGARVTIVERQGLASGASGANSGVVQHPFDPILAALYRETVDLYRELSALDLGFRLGDDPVGLLYASNDEQAVRGVDLALAEGFPELSRDVVNGTSLQRLEPALAPGLWACRVGIGYPVQPGASTYAYATLAERRGVTIRQGRAANLHVRGDTAAGVIVDGRPLTADAVLVAAGPWSSAVIDPTGAWRPIRERWASSSSSSCRPDRATSWKRRRSARPSARRRTRPIPTWPTSASSPGRHRVGGSTFLAREPDPAAWVEPILRRASSFVPGVADAPIRGTRACARPQSADGRPLIGRVAGRRGLVVCAGHGSWGISTGPASARLAADLILGREPLIPAELDPARFGAPPSG